MGMLMRRHYAEQTAELPEPPKAAESAVEPEIVSPDSTPEPVVEEQPTDKKKKKGN
jgi:hypothetical protein